MNEIHLDEGPVAVLGDLHFGARGDSAFFLDHFVSFVKNQLIPECHKRGAKTVIQLGDFLDRRKFVNFNTLHVLRTEVFEAIRSSGLTFVAVLGNHDVFNKNTNRVNGMRELFGHLESEGWFKIIEEPTSIRFGSSGKTGLAVPWICEENRKRVEDSVKSSSAQYAFGHFEFVGFDMYRGVACEHGDDHSSYSGFRRVYSGHFHTKSIRSNVFYLGTPYEIIWSDAGDDKGFNFLYPDSDRDEWVSNPEKIHVKIVYDDSRVDYDELDLTGMAKKYLKVIAVRVENQKMFERFVKRIYDEASPIHVSVMDSTETPDTELSDSEEAVSQKDPLTALLDEIDLKYGTDGSGMKLKVGEIYVQAVSEVAE